MAEPDGRGNGEWHSASRLELGAPRLTLSFGKIAMSNTHDSFRKKVDDIFQDLAGPDRAKWISADVPSRCMLQIANALSRESDYPQQVGWDIGFNVADWHADAAFLVALHLFPERFTDEEIDEAVRSLLIHVPAHVIAAARLAGHSTDDIFGDIDERAEPGAAPNGGPAAPLGNSSVTEGPPSVS